MNVFDKLSFLIVWLLHLEFDDFSETNFVVVVFLPQGEAFAREHGLIFMETSAKTAANVEEVR